MRVQNILNSRPRKRLGYMTPKEKYKSLTNKEFDAVALSVWIQLIIKRTMIIDDYEKIKGIDLTINPTLHQRNWTYYYQQYITAFSCLLDVSRSCNYQTNFRYMAFLFLMRHSLELLLKNQLEQNQTAPIKSISMSHNLLQLANLTGEDKIAFERDFNVLKCDSEGDCFRYLTDNNNVQYFTGTIDSFDVSN